MNPLTRQPLRTVSLRASARRHARWLLLGLMLMALLLAPMLGLMHRVVHSPLTHGAPQGQRAAPAHLGHSQQADEAGTPARGHVHAAAHDHTAHASAAHDAESGWVASLFGDHEDDSTCRLVDQIGGLDCLPTLAPLLLMAVVPPFLLRLQQAVVSAREAALFDARAPPVLH